MGTSSIAAAQVLTDKQKAFIREYLKNGGNGKAAAEAAGYSTSGSAVAASRLLQQPAIAEAVRAGIERQNGRAEGILGEEAITPERVLTEVARIAYADPLHVLDDSGMPRALKDMPESTRRAVSKIKVKVTDDGASVVEFAFWDKPKALELLGKRLALFTDKVQLSGDGTGEPLQILVQTYREGGET